MEYIVYAVIYTLTVPIVLKISDYGTELLNKVLKRWQDTGTTE